MKKSEHFMKFEKVSDQGIISGYITKFGVVDSYGTATAKGCFKSTIARMEAGEVIPVLWQHDPHEPIGKFLSIKDDDVGTYAVIQLDLNVARAREAFSLIKNDIISGLSIGGYIIETEVNEETQVLIMTDIELFETSVVTFPACDEARIDDCRSNSLNIRDMEHAFRKSGMFSQTDSKKLAKYFYNFLKTEQMKEPEKQEIVTESQEIVIVDESIEVKEEQNTQKSDENVLKNLINTLQSFKL